MTRHPARAWGMRLGAVAFGLLLLATGEGALRATGRWADAPPAARVAGWEEGARLVESEDRPRLEPTTVDGQPGWRTSRSLVQQRFMQDEAWTTAPPAETLRIFAFGGSSTYGVPVEARPEATWPGRMATWLGQLGVAAQVHNLGGASFGTDQVLALASAVVEHGPDVLVVHAADNEFFQYDLALYRRNQAYPTTRAGFQRLHLFRALASVLAPPPQAVQMDEAVDQQRQVVARIVEASLAAEGGLPQVDALGRWERRDPHHAAVVGRYRSNLRALEQVAAAAGARLLLVEVPANLQQEPWLSLHRPDLSTLQRRRVASLLAESSAARGAGDPQAALGPAERAVAIDPIYAASWFALGMARQEAGDLAGAEAALRNALELDMDPGRPVAALGREVRALAADGGAERVDLGPLLQAPEAGPFGQHLFHDSCHLTEAAYDALGRHLAMAVRLGG